MAKAWEAPATDPRIADRGVPDPRRARRRDRHRASSSRRSPARVLAAAFTVGLVIAGHFGADLKNFEQVVESAPVAWIARALYYALPNLAPFDVKTQFVHAQPVAAGYVGADGRLRRALCRRAADAGRRCSSRGETSSDAAACRRAEFVFAVAVLLGAAVGRAGASAIGVRHRPAGRAGPLRPVAGDRAAPGALVTICWPPTSTGSAPCSTSAARARRRAGPRLRAAVSAAGHGHRARPDFNIAYRFGAIFLSEPKPAGPGRPDLAEKLLAQGPGRAADEVGVHAGHRLRPFLGDAGLQGCGRVVRAGSRLPGAAWFLKPLAADDAGPGRPPQRVADAVPRPGRVGRERLDAARTRRAASVSSTRWTRWTSCGVSSASTAQRGGARR